MWQRGERVSRVLKFHYRTRWGSVHESDSLSVIFSSPAFLPGFNAPCRRGMPVCPSDPASCSSPSNCRFSLFLSLRWIRALNEGSDTLKQRAIQARLLTISCGEQITGVVPFSFLLSLAENYMCDGITIILSIEIERKSCFILSRYK